MDTLFYIIIVILSLCVGYFFAKKYLFLKEHHVHTSGKIEKISVVLIGEMWSPELLIDYSFHYDGKEYQGSDYLSIDKFVGSKYVYLGDQNGFPVLVTHSEDFIGEEYIETFLLEHRLGVPIEFNIASLPYSRIFKVERRKDTMFENVEIHFPWTR